MGSKPSTDNLSLANVDWGDVNDDLKAMMIVNIERIVAGWKTLYYTQKIEIERLQHKLDVFRKCVGANVSMSVMRRLDVQSEPKEARENPSDR